MKIWGYLFLFTAFLSSQSVTANAKDIHGLWLTENERAVISFFDCEHGVCGNVHWIIEGGQQFDIHNEDPAKRNDPICGMTILWGFEKDGMNEWSDGYIYKADDGDTYHADIELLDDGRMKLRGHVGVSFLGKTQYWTRVDADNYQPCETP